MLNYETHLREYQKNPEMGAIRDGFGQGLLEAAARNSNVVGLCADLTESVRMHHFAKQFPERFIEVGVAEQNLVGVAAGTALAGKIPFAASYAVFSPGRSWDQTRVSVCYSNLNVKLVGGHAGITVGPDGASHQALEDIAITRVLPNMTVIVPCDQDQAYKATMAAAEHVGPLYLRLSRIKTVSLTTARTHFEIGKAQLFKEGKDVSIIATGIMVHTALQAAAELASHNISAEVINMHTIKPIDRDAILNSALKTKAVVTAEEHQVTGGLGGAVAEVLSSELPTPLQRVGVKNTFGESGQPNELLEKYGLTSSSIKKAVHEVLKMKKRGAYVNTL